jgi:hypothetical protein
MERFCGKLGVRIISRLHPYATLPNYIKRSARISQLKACYTRVWQHISMDAMDLPLSGREFVYPECEPLFLPTLTVTHAPHLDPHSILRSPRTHGHMLAPEVRRQVAQYFAEVYGCSWTQIQQIIPDIVTR